MSCSGGTVRLAFFSGVRANRATNLRGWPTVPCRQSPGLCWRETTRSTLGFEMPMSEFVYRLLADESFEGF